MANPLGYCPIPNKAFPTSTAKTNSASCNKMTNISPSSSAWGRQLPSKGSWQGSQRQAWATGWTKEPLPPHYFIVVRRLGTLADVQNQSKNYYCQGRVTNGSDSVQSFGVFQGQSPQFVDLGWWLEYVFWTGDAGWFVLIMAWEPNELVTVIQGRGEKCIPKHGHIMPAKRKQK